MRSRFQIDRASDNFGVWLVLMDLGLLTLAVFFGHRFYVYATMRISKILGPV